MWCGLQIFISLKGDFIEHLTMYREQRVNHGKLLTVKHHSRTGIFKKSAALSGSLSFTNFEPVCL
jgi:hypothetical protein